MPGITDSIRLVRLILKLLNKSTMLLTYWMSLNVMYDFVGSMGRSSSFRWGRGSLGIKKSKRVGSLAKDDGKYGSMLPYLSFPFVNRYMFEGVSFKKSKSKNNLTPQRNQSTAKTLRGVLVQLKV